MGKSNRVLLLDGDTEEKLWENLTFTADPGILARAQRQNDLSDKTGHRHAQAEAFDPWFARQKRHKNQKKRTGKGRVR